MPRLSIVIPVLGNSAKLDDTLVSVLENRPAHCEIFVVHNEPYDDPYQLSGEVCFVEAPRGACLAECLNLGVLASTSPFVHVLMCGVEVCAGWANAALRRFHDPEVAAVAAVIVDRDDRSLVASAGLGYRAEGTVWRPCHGNFLTAVTARSDDPTGPDLLAAFFRKSVLESIGGFTAWTCEPLVGADLALSLRHAKLRCALEPDCVAHVEPAEVADRCGFAYGRDAERFFWRWAAHNGRFRSLVGHAALLVGEGITTLLRPTRIAQLAGRAWGLAQAAFRRPPMPEGLESGVSLILPCPHLTDAGDRAETPRTARVA